MNKITIVILLLLLTNISFGQNSIEKSALEFFDNVIGQKNLDINSGIKFNRKYRFLDNEHHFYNKNEFINGTVNYNGHTYYNIPILYDVFEDNLIIKIASKFDSYSIVLDKKKTTYFSIGTDFFEKDNSFGYLQKLAQKKGITLFKKNHKRRKNRIHKNILLSKFLPENTYYIKLNDKAYLVNTRSQWKKVFPSSKKSINSFYKSNKKELTHSKDDFFINLLKTIN
jgi:hypothetical protein